ncbi:MAG: hypothetical protein U5K74_13355 [Gemmatimonadaceae bacterium]|nr:hypothetical protein [Gemmatimonadaceae bacterium]
MTYARKRLWLGITGVGTTVLLCLAALLFDLPHRVIDPYVDSNFDTALAVIALTWMLHAAVLFPLDVLGGLVVVREPAGALRWFGAWLRGVTVQWIWFALAAALLLRTAQQFGLTKALLVFILLQLVLLSRQGVMAWLVGGLHVRAPSDALKSAAGEAGWPGAAVREIESAEPSFVGGWSGIDAKKLWVPARWVEQLTPEQLMVALQRRVAVRTLGLRRRGVLVAVAWNTVGFTLAAGAPRADLVTAAGFITTMAWFTLWSFVGVLVLPTVSRAAVFTADRIARRTHDAAVVGATIAQLDAWQDDEAERGEKVETIFHPVPSRGSRLRALDHVGAEASENAGATTAAGAWHATRMMLFLSWAGLGGLARAVHCNIGRPAVWVMLPGD